MRLTMSEILDAGRRQAGLSTDELWIRYYSLGGSASPADFEQYLDGRSLPSNLEYDVVAQAMNEWFADANQDHPVPYSDELPD